jgi:hypothetical protein
MTAPDRIIASFHGHCAIDGKTYPYGQWFAVDNPLRSSGVEYTRLDLNTRIVTVDQLERFRSVSLSGLVSDEIRAIIGKVE